MLTGLFIIDALIKIEVAARVPST